MCVGRFKIDINSFNMLSILLTKIFLFFLTSLTGFLLVNAFDCLNVLSVSTPSLRVHQMGAIWGSSPSPPPSTLCALCEWISQLLEKCIIYISYMSYISIFNYLNIYVIPKIEILLYVWIMLLQAASPPLHPQPAFNWINCKHTGI